jgi:cytochrome b6-f complex iron-sulfur subunit
MSGARRLHRLMVACYPHAWRQRYGDELLEVLADRRSGWRDLPNLLAGALDARINVRLRPADGLLLAAPQLPVPAPSASVTLPTPPQRRPGIVSTKPPLGVMSRRGFLRRVLGFGTALLSLEFAAGTISFLWPQIREGIGAQFRVGTIADVLAAEPRFANGWPYAFNPARIFLVNVPAAKSLVENPDNPESVPDPGTNVGPDVPLVDASVLALYRKCPHLGCQIPQLCDQSEWFECLCHGSKYTILGEKRDGPAPRGLDRFNVLVDENGVYTVDTSELVSGPPIGTETFDSRGPTEMQHCTG